MKKDMTKDELKKRVRMAFDMCFGFRPNLNEIVLLESSGDGAYIRVQISVYEYVIRADEFFPDDLLYVFRVVGHDEIKIS